MRYRKELKQILLEIGIEEKKVDGALAELPPRLLRWLYTHFKTHGHLEFCPGGMHEALPRKERVITTVLVKNETNIVRGTK